MKTGKKSKQSIKAQGLNVPCDGCTLCCCNDAIFLKPHLGDNVDDYLTQPHPEQKDKLILAHKENGECIYLGAGGCTIHGKAPIVCREFDCRQLVKNMGYFESYQAVQRGIISKDLLKRAIYLINVGA